MSTYTENYGLTMPNEEDYYNVGVYNENLSTLDSELAATSAEVETVSEKIGSPTDTGSDTVFGKLNSGGSLVKSIQTVFFDTTANSGTHTQSLTTVVDPSRCVVIMDRLRDGAGLGTRIAYSLTADSINLTATHANGNYDFYVKFQIIEFY